MYYRPSLSSQANIDAKKSFELHTWMIARLIEKSGGTNRLYLSSYVIAVCYERMITRLGYRVSKSFHDALKTLPPTFKFPKQIPPIRGSKSNDSRFINFLIKVTKPNDDYVSILKVDTPIVNLVKHVKDLYNQETYADFHSILCEILDLFIQSLHDLKKLHHNLGGKAPSVEQLDAILAKIEFIAIVGTLLRLLVKSHAIKRCLYSVVGFLPDRAAGVKAKVDNKTDDDDRRDRDEEEDGLHRDYEDEDEDELEGNDESNSVGQGSASNNLQPKSQACLRSLNLGVVYIDAILVLSHFVTSRNIEINISLNVLLLPYPNQSKNSDSDSDMLPWKTLLRHDTYFPGKPSPSANSIVEFLESQTSSTGNQRSNTTDDQKLSKKGQTSSKKSQKSNKLPVSTEVSPESVAEELRSLRLVPESTIITSKIDQAISSLSTLQFGDTTPGSKKYIDAIIRRVKGLYSNYMTDEMDDILEMLKTLSDNTRLERMLREGSPLDTGTGFKGKLHAEACVAAHCTFTDPKWFSEPVSYFIIIFCSDLLILLVVYYTSSRCI
jgi:hypothetical protein